jgi:hypothetical protein
MMVKNQTDMAEFVGGALVPPDGEFHQVKDGDDVREAIAVGTLTAKRERSSGGTPKPDAANDNDDDGGDDK